MVWKPSPYTPLSSLLVGELLVDVFPPGVLNTVSGDSRFGPMLVEHPSTRAISLTGSVATGKAVATAAGDLKRVVLELGGNDPAVVLPDADVEAIAADVFSAGFINCGQTCTAIKQVHVAAPLREPSWTRSPPSLGSSWWATVRMTASRWDRRTTRPSFTG